MGVFGLGTLREIFSERSYVVTGQYVCCLDVSRWVVLAARNCVVAQTPQHFQFTLRDDLLNSREMIFLKKYPPARLCYTLDHGSPLPKRLTQEARKMESQVPMLRALAQQQQQQLLQRRSATDGRAVDTAIIAPLRIAQLAPVIRRLLLSEEFRPSATCEVSFDYERGEGEIKAIRWLYAQREWPTKLIMSRDNDVFVYALSVLQHQVSTDAPPRLLVYHASSNSVLSCWSHLLPRHRTTCWIFLLWLSICFGNDYAHGILQRSISDVSYHFTLLQRHFVKFKSGAAAAYRDDMFRRAKCRADENNNDGGSDGGDVTFADAKHIESPREGNASGRYGDLARLIGHGGDKSGDKSGDKNGDYSASDGIDGVDVLTAAIVQLQRVLSRGSAKSYGLRGDGDEGGGGDRSGGSSDELESMSSYPSARRGMSDVWRVHTRRKRLEVSTDVGDTGTLHAARQLTRRRRTCDSTKIGKMELIGEAGNAAATIAEKDEESALIRAWLGRQIWSILYILELPVNFIRNESFALCPSIHINTEFAMPYLSRAKFLQIPEATIRRELACILEKGISCKLDARTASTT